MKESAKRMVSWAAIVTVAMFLLPWLAGGFAPDLGGGHTLSATIGRRLNAMAERMRRGRLVGMHVPVWPRLPPRLQDGLAGGRSDPAPVGDVECVAEMSQVIRCRSHG
ncbi:MAG: hypothetical protein QOJ80_566 [Mycobacterium sp.]|nr:hypothetical protein [Mycobacterium sp.]